MNVKVSAKDMDDFIWMSYRYCIGRKTIAASCHAGTIAILIILSFCLKNVLSLFEMKFQDTIKWNKFIKFEKRIFIFCLYV